MCATFTDDDIGKTVVNANGEEIGIVSAVEHGSARVEPDPGVTDTIKAKLGWEDTNEETYPLQEHSVSRVTDDEVHLEQDLAGVSEADSGTGVGTNDVGDDTGITDDSGVGSNDRGITDDNRGVTDDSGIGDDTGITDDSGVGSNDRGVTDDDDDLIGDDDDGLTDDDDDLIGDDDDDDLIGDDDDDDDLL